MKLVTKLIIATSFAAVTKIVSNYFIGNEYDPNNPPFIQKAIKLNPKLKQYDIKPIVKNVNELLDYFAIYNEQHQSKKIKDIIKCNFNRVDIDDYGVYFYLNENLLRGFNAKRKYNSEDGSIDE